MPRRREERHIEHFCMIGVMIAKPTQSLLRTVIAERAEAASALQPRLGGYADSLSRPMPFSSRWVTLG